MGRVELLASGGFSALREVPVRPVDHLDRCPHLERIVAKRRNGLYRPGYRGWTKVKNPSYWRSESETAQMQRCRERRAMVTSA